MKNRTVIIAVLGVASLALLLFYFDSTPQLDPGATSGTLTPVAEDTLEPVDQASGPWLDPDGAPLPFRSDAEVEDFLSTADVVHSKRISEGVNGIDKILLEKDGVRAHAGFRDVSVVKNGVMSIDGVLTTKFRDDCIFEVAAYRLSRMLGLDNVPPTVLRRIKRRKGTLQLWIEAAFTEKKRQKEQLRAPGASEWRRQVQGMYLFDQLIANDDRNQGNILIDEQWKLWMIDHTRSFRTRDRPTTIEIVRECDREMWERLQELDPNAVKEALKGILSGREIRMLFRRRDRLVEHIQERIERLGPDSVLR